MCQSCSEVLMERLRESQLNILSASRLGTALSLASERSHLIPQKTAGKSREVSFFGTFDYISSTL